MLWCAGALVNLSAAHITTTPRDNNAKPYHVFVAIYTNKFNRFRASSELSLPCAWPVRTFAVLAWIYSLHLLHDEETSSSSDTLNNIKLITTTVINGIVTVCKAIISGIVAFFGIVVCIFPSAIKSPTLTTPRPTASPVARRAAANAKQQVESSTTHLPDQRDSAEADYQEVVRVVDGWSRSGRCAPSIQT